MKLKFVLLVTLLSSGLSCFSQKTNWEQDLHAHLNQLADSLSANLHEWKVPEMVYKVEKYGAVGDGKTINTKAIQAAIDACSANGGGVVLFSKGEYVTGTIDLKSGVMLEIRKKAKILGSTYLKDYPDRVAKRKTVMDTHMDIRHSLIYAEGVKRVGICGEGTIDFRGSAKNFPGKETIAALPGRPFGIRIIDSEEIVVKDITLRESPSWMQSYLNCKYLIFRNIKNYNNTNYNQDGLDLDGCQYVIVRDCFFDVYDDSMCLKGTSFKPTQDILIENSTFYSKCNSLKIGTDTQGDFRRIFARNLVLGAPPVDDTTFFAPSPTESGITLATVDGGDVEDILITNVVINRANCPVFIRIGNRGRVMPGMPEPPVGKLRRIVIDGVTGKKNLKQGSFISGIKDGVIEDVIIRNMNIEMEGGVVNLKLKEVRENEGGYPDAHNFTNPLPAYGFFIRHARNITLDNVNIIPTSEDQRPMFFSGGNILNVTVNGRILD